ncbi:hypothetical protein AHAS_Ahas02G0173700 [Arachis hypogaea]
MASNEGSSATSSHRGVRGRFVHERANNMGLNKLRDNTEMFMWSLCNYLRNKFKLLQHSDVKQSFLIAPHEPHFQIVHHILREHVMQTPDYKVNTFDISSLAFQDDPWF